MFSLHTLWFQLIPKRKKIWLLCWRWRLNKRAICRPPGCIAPSVTYWPSSTWSCVPWRPPTTWRREWWSHSGTSLWSTVAGKSGTISSSQSLQNISTLSRHGTACDVLSFKINNITNTSCKLEDKYMRPVAWLTLLILVCFCDRKSKKEMSCQSEKEEQVGAQEREIKNTIYKNLMFNKTPQDLQNIIKHLPEGMSLHSEFCCLKSHFYIKGLIIQSRNSNKCFPRFYNKKCTESWRLNCIGIDEKCTSSMLKLDCNYFIGKRLAAHWIKLKKTHLTFLKKEYIYMCN